MHLASSCHLICDNIIYFQNTMVIVYCLGWVSCLVLEVVIMEKEDLVDIHCGVVHPVV